MRTVDGAVRRIRGNRLLAGVSGVALACWLPGEASAATYYADNFAELQARITTANSDGDPTSTIVLTSSFTTPSSGGDPDGPNQAHHHRYARFHPFRPAEQRHPILGRRRHEDAGGHVHGYRRRELGSRAANPERGVGHEYGPRPGRNKLLRKWRSWRRFRRPRRHRYLDQSRNHSRWAKYKRYWGHRRLRANRCWADRQHRHDRRQRQWWRNRGQRRHRLDRCCQQRHHPGWYRRRRDRVERHAHDGHNAPGVAGRFANLRQRGGKRDGVRDHARRRERSLHPDRNQRAGQSDLHGRGNPGFLGRWQYRAA